MGENFILENGNNNNSSSKNLTINCENPYEFDDGSETSEIKYDPNLCSCCGENKETAHKNLKFSCVYCKKTFKYYNKLNSHVKQLHSTSNTSIPCSRCDARCSDESVYLKHMQSHDKNRSYICANCNKNFTRKYHLARHLSHIGCDGRNKISYPCKVCGYVFTRKDNLQIHLRNHLEKNAKEKNSDEKKLEKCIKCNKKYREKHTNCGHKCIVCEKIIMSKSGFVKHLRRHTGEKPFSCQQCGKSFAAKEVLNRHAKIHLDKKPHCCKECGKSFIQYTQLQNHMAHHNNVSYKCKYCEILFSKKSALINHEKFQHEGAEKLICPHGCSKTFLNKRTLKKHLDIHSDEKPHECQTCHKHFRTKILLASHERIHRHETVRSCSKCHRTFLRGDCLLRHIRKKHPDLHKTLHLDAVKKKVMQMKMETQGFKIKLDKQQKVITYAQPETVVEKNIRSLLTLLVDSHTLSLFNWPECCTEEVINTMIKKFGCEPIVSAIDKIDRLRENVKTLLTLVINDDSMKTLIERNNVDYVVGLILEENAS